MHSADVQPGADPTAAVTHLLDEYGPRIYALGLRLCGSEADAEDLVQETFLQAFRKWHTFEGRSQPGTWLYTIATRACRRKHRKRAGEPAKMASLDEVSPFGEQKIPELPAETDGPVQEHQRREALDRVGAAITTLPPEYRLPIVLKDIIELPVAEVAQILQLKEATVKTRVHRARLMVRKAMIDGLPEREGPAPLYAKRVCLDLLKAKLDAQDRDGVFPIGNSVVCERCRSVFATLDVTRDVCSLLGRGRLPKELGERLRALIASAG